MKHLREHLDVSEKVTCGKCSKRDQCKLKDIQFSHVLERAKTKRLKKGIETPTKLPSEPAKIEDV
jgi:hypothetical protein